MLSLIPVSALPYNLTLAPVRIEKWAGIQVSQSWSPLNQQIKVAVHSVSLACLLIDLLNQQATMCSPENLHMHE